MTDLAREIEALLDSARYHEQARTDEDPRTEMVPNRSGDWLLCIDALPLLATYVQRKLDEAKAETATRVMQWREAASALKLSPTHLSDIENGRRAPSPDALDRIMDLLIP